MLLIGRGGSCCLSAGVAHAAHRSSADFAVARSICPGGRAPRTPALLGGRISPLLAGRRGASRTPCCCWLVGSLRCWLAGGEAPALHAAAGWPGLHVAGWGGWVALGIGRGRGWWRLAEKRLRALRFARNGNGRVEARVITCVLVSLCRSADGQRTVRNLPG